MEKHIVSKSILLDASPSAVWDALTNPEKTKEYFFGCKVYSGWKVGDSIVFKRKILWIFPFELSGRIEQIEPGKFLQYKLYNKSDKSGFSLVTDRLSTENGKTKLEITDDVGAGNGAEKRYQKSVEGWDKILDGLREYLKQNHQS